MLNREFINAWVLAKNLEPLSRQAASPEVREWTARFRADYTYPVDSIIYTPDGRKLANAPANELPKRSPHDAYLKFLHKGLSD